MRARRLALAALLAASPLAAQMRPNFAGELTVGNARLRTDPVSGTPQALSGVVGGGRGTIGYRIVALEGWYYEGNLDADSGTSVARTLVDGALFVSLRPTRWLSVRAGRHLRAYVADAGTRQLSLWEARLRAEGWLVSDRVSGNVELFRSLSAEVNVGAPLDHLMGGSAGVTFFMPRSPLWGRVTYRIDQAETTDGGTEMLDGIIVAIGIGGR